jgi:hypothetical protein
MQLFHGSITAVTEPLIINRFKTLDFGTGFYTTPNEQQAQEFAVKAYQRRKSEGIPTVSVFSFEEQLARQELRILHFDEPNTEWLHFVVHNRRFGRTDDNYDLIIGPVANDDVFTTIALFEAGQLDEESAIKRFKIKKLFSQYLFCNNRALAFLAPVQQYPVEVPHGR